MIGKRMRQLMESTLADARADVDARVKAGARRLDENDPADRIRIEQNRAALEAAMPSAEEMIEAVLGPGWDKD